MPDFNVKNIPDKLYQRLKKSAEVHHRSINGEFIACLERVLLPCKLSAEEQIAIARRLRKKVKQHAITSDEITLAKNQGRA